MLLQLKIQSQTKEGETNPKFEPLDEVLVVVFGSLGGDGGLPARQTLPFGKPGLDDLDEDLGDEGFEVGAEDVEELGLGGRHRIPSRDALRQNPGVKIRRLVAR